MSCLTDCLTIWDSRRKWCGAPAASINERAGQRRGRGAGMTKPTIGFIGTGRMGGPMAGRLMDAGYTLSIYDAQEDATKPLVARGARLAHSPAEVASASDIVLTSLPTPDIVKTVALGPNGLSSGNRARIVIDLSTSGPGAAKLIAQEFEPRSIK